jgi:hypothetical protein
VRELAREWIASITSFTRGHGGGERANASVGAAFVIGALVVAVLGLRWISAEGPTEEAADETPWDFQDSSSSGETTGTTIPASVPAAVVIVRDPGDPPAGETVVTLPDGQTGIFLPGFPPTPGGTTGTTGPGSDGTDPPGSGSGTTRPGTGNPTVTTRPNPGTGPGSTNPPTTQTSTTPPTVPDTTTSTEPTTTTTLQEELPVVEALDLGAEVSDLVGSLGQLIF